MQTETPTPTNGSAGDPYPAGTLPGHAPAAMKSLEEKHAWVRLEQLEPSKTNPRTHFNEQKIAGLALSMRDKGVVQPLIVRPHPKARRVAKGQIDIERFEIVAGETRYRAAKIAGLVDVPVIVRDYSDEQALEIQLIENEHRFDLTDLELAHGYRALITSNPDKHSAQSIADRIGKSATWVWDTLKLLDLIPEAMWCLEESRIARGHAVLVSRLKPADQARVIKPPTQRYGPGSASLLWQIEDARLDLDTGKAPNKDSKYDGLKPITVRELEHAIAHHIRFDVDHAVKAQPFAFEQTASAVADALAKPGRGRKTVWITHDYRVSDAARDDSERTYGQNSWKRADGAEKSKTCEYSVLGIFAAGAEQGRTRQVCVARDRCTVHFADVVRAKQKAADLRAKGQTKKAAKVEQRKEQSWDRDNRLRAERQQRWALVKPHAVAAIAAKVKNAPITDALLLGIIEDANVDVKELLALLGEKKITAKNFVRAYTLCEILDQDYSAENLAPYAKKYGVDLKALQKKHLPAAPVKAEATS